MTRPTNASHETHISDHDACTVRRLISEVRKDVCDVLGANSEAEKRTAGRTLHADALQLCRAMEAVAPCFEPLFAKAAE